MIKNTGVIKNTNVIKKVVITLALILWPLNLILNIGRLHLSAKTIFEKDYQAEQLILRNIHLYPNIPMARLFQNKPRIYINKYINNFFILIDPNNYFFATHPEPVPGGLNLAKYSFPTIIFFFLGIYYLKKSKHKNLIVFTSIASIFILPILNTLEGLDFILWIPVSLTIINGVSAFENKNKKLFEYYSLFFILFTIPEILRIFFNK